MSGDTIYEVKIYEVKETTQKAVRVLIQVIIDEIDTKKIDVWLPKSRTSIEGNAILIPEWLIQAKVNEISSNMEAEIKIVAMNKETSQVHTFKSGG